MKKKVFVLLVFTAVTVNTFAQRAFDYLKDSLVNVLTLSTVAQIVNFDYDGANGLLGTYLEAGKSLAMTGNFSAGVQYMMLSAPHALDQDVDLKVYQGRGTSGTVIAKDTSIDSTCAVRFTPAASGYYTYELINSSDAAVFVSLVRLKATRNPNFTLISLAEALDITLALSKELVQILPPTSKIPANKWALFGGSVSEGNSAGYYNSMLNRGTYVIVGAGESSTYNVDCEIMEQRAYDQRGSNTVSINSGATIPGDFAIFSADPSKYYEYKVFNRSSRNSSAFLFGFMIQTSGN